MAAAQEARTEDPIARREAIRRLIRSRKVATQEELRELLLKEEGFDVTQATLSRDLARIGARRATLPEGGSAYELEGFSVASVEHPLAQLRPMVVDMDFNDSMVVVHTIPGAASPVALALDRARLQEVLGTIAGDDTVFVAPRRAVSPGRVFKQLKSLMKVE